MSFLDPELSIRSEFFVFLEQNAYLILIRCLGFKATLQDLFDSGWKVELVEMDASTQFPQIFLTNLEENTSIVFKFDRPVSTFFNAHQVVKFIEFEGFRLKGFTLAEFKSKVQIESDEDVLFFLGKILQFQEGKERLKGHESHFEANKVA